jgi:hypothetical protein
LRGTCSIVFVHFFGADIGFHVEGFVSPKYAMCITI